VALTPTFFLLALLLLLSLALFLCLLLSLELCDLVPVGCCVLAAHDVEAKFSEHLDCLPLACLLLPLPQALDILDPELLCGAVFLIFFLLICFALLSCWLSRRVMDERPTTKVRIEVH
jgi:hypothetical protein